MRASMIMIAGVLLGFSHETACAQSSPFQGTFTAASDADAPRIDQAIEKAVAPMNFVTRPIARGRLKKTNPAYRVIRIEQQPTHIAIQFDDRKPVQMPADGHAVKWTREDGEVFDVSATTQAGVLTQTFKAEDGERVNRFSLSPDGSTMTLEVTITSPRLPDPVKYSLTYNRQLDRKNPHFEFTGNGP
jgi:hypothetical protein